ncbi:MAG: glycyl-radical enzyme activating protein [Deltaproteobacteria bacterium]|nr:glycyl-radical enzyme activating protein [Deltaproteobacteria bacterium]
MSGRETRPLVVDVRHNSLDDGPGVRTAVFFKGCPLRCVWCHNPEAISPKAELAWFQKKCLACGACVKACRHGATQAGCRPEAVGRSRSSSDSGIRPPASSLQSPAFFRDRCQACFACVDGCPSGARRRAGRPVELDALVAEILKDEPFYRNSGGGVTLSGGEPMMFVDFSGGLLKALKEQGVHTIVETCGLFNLEKFVNLALPYANAVYFDMKFFAPELHARHTGVGNEVILKNLAALAAAAREKILPRVPLIPGLTATPENLRAIGAHLRSLGFTEAKLLPYNPLWPEKAAAVGRRESFRHDGFMKREEVEECERVFAAALKG